VNGPDVPPLYCKQARCALFVIIPHGVFNWGFALLEFSSRRAENTSAMR
jgi:hypothetical protein